MEEQLPKPVQAYLIPQPQTANNPMVMILSQYPPEDFQGQQGDSSPSASADNRNGARQTVSDESSAFFTPAPVNGRSRLSNDSENEREYRDTVECGVLDKVTGERVYKKFIEFFKAEVEVFCAESDAQKRELFRPSALSKAYGWSTNRISMFLKKKRGDTEGIFQAVGYKEKAPSKFGLKIGAYFLSLDVCKLVAEEFAAFDKNRSSIALYAPTSSSLWKSSTSSSNSDNIIQVGSANPQSRNPNVINNEAKTGSEMTLPLASLEAYKAAVAATKSNIVYPNGSSSGSRPNNIQEAAFLQGYHGYGHPANSSFPQFLYGMHPQSAAIYGQIFSQVHSQNFNGHYMHSYQSSTAQTSDTSKASVALSNGSVSSIPPHLVSQLQSYSTSTSSNSSSSSSSASATKTPDNLPYLSSDSSPDAKAAALASLLNTQIDRSNSNLFTHRPILSHASSLSSQQSSLKDDSDSSEDTKFSSKT